MPRPSEGNRLLRSRALRVAGAALLATSLSACVSMHQQRLAPGEEPTLIGPAVRDNRTPMDGALACLAAGIAARGKPPLVIAVGDVRDYTGKYSVSEGNAITQGGALMVYSALGKLGSAVALAERFDPVIAERELGYTDRRQLGDGQIHDVTGPTGAGKVPWLPYFGGSIAASDYYIVGGITELNYNIRSGGIETGASGIGPKARTFTQSVAIDLRIVDTRSLLVVRTVSLTKQFTGYEVGFNIFRFFGSSLFDINIGAKGQEPLQLGIRTALEEATLRLVASVTKADPAPCLARRSWDGDAVPPPTTHMLQLVSDTAARAGAAVGTAINAAVAAEARDAGGVISLPFEIGSAELTGTAASIIDQIAAAAAKAPVDVAIVARDSETLDPAKRDALTDQRIAALVTALAARGIAPARVAMRWRPAPTDTAVQHDRPGLQALARLRIAN